MTAPAPLVSVVVPTKDRRRLLERAVRSVRAQTVQDLEILIVDDGSSDDTAVWLASLAHDPQVRTWSVPNGGVSAARNLALRAATGTWVAFLDDDNEWLPTYLGAQLATAEAAPDCGLVHALARTRHEDGTEVVHPEPTLPASAFDSLLGWWFPLLSACMVRRDHLERVGGFREDLEVAEDWDLLMRLAGCTEFAVTPEPLLIRHVHAAPRLSHGFDRMRRSFVRLDRDWAQEIRRRSGRQGLRRFRRARIYEGYVFEFMTRFDRDGRRGAARALVGLAGHLPGSLVAMGRPVVGMVVGPHAYAAARSAHHRLRSLLP